MTYAKYHTVGIAAAVIAVVFPVFDAYAFVPVLVEQGHAEDITYVEDPTLAQGFYGALQDFPHTYEFRVEEPMGFFAQIHVPDNDAARNVLSGILVRQPERKGRVSEIARLNADDAAWETVFDTRGGDHYRAGAAFEAALEPGVYVFQVYSPDNREKYVLRMGTREEMTLGYFAYLGRLIEVKKFLGKSPLMIVASPLVYIPIGLILVLLLVRKRTYIQRIVGYTR